MARFNGKKRLAVLAATTFAVAGGLMTVTMSAHAAEPVWEGPYDQQTCSDNSFPHAQDATLDQMCTEFTAEDSPTGGGEGFYFRYIRN